MVLIYCRILRPPGLADEAAILAELDRQESVCRSFAEADGFQVSRIVRDPWGIGGMRVQLLADGVTKPVGLTAVAAAMQPEVYSALIAESPAVFSQDEADAGAVMEWAISAGLEVLVVTGHLNTAKLRHAYEVDRAGRQAAWRQFWDMMFERMLHSASQRDRQSPQESEWPT